MLTHNSGSCASQCAGAVLECADLPAQTLTQGLLLYSALQDRLSNSISLQPSHRNTFVQVLNFKGDSSFSLSHFLALHAGGQESDIVLLSNFKLLMFIFYMKGALCTCTSYSVKAKIIHY